MKATKQIKTKERRPYEEPRLLKHRNLKSITLFTDFGPPGSRDGSDESDYDYHSDA